MQRRPHLELNAEDQRAMKVWSRSTVAVVGLIMVLAIGIPIVMQRYEPKPEARAASPESTAICASWDQAAGGVIATLVRSKGDPDLRRTGDALFQMRRARRNCEAGWINLACGDYQTIMRMMQSEVVVDRSAAIARCQSIDDPSRMVEMPGN